MITLSERICTHCIANLRRHTREERAVFTWEIKGKSASSSVQRSEDPQWDKITCKVDLNWKKKHE